MKIEDIPSIGFIGGGNMARSIIGGLLDVNFQRNSIIASDPLEQARRYLIEHFRIAATETIAKSSKSPELSCWLSSRKSCPMRWKAYETACSKNDLW